MDNWGYVHKVRFYPIYCIAISKTSVQVAHEMASFDRGNEQYDNKLSRI